MTNLTAFSWCPTQSCSLTPTVPKVISPVQTLYHGPPMPARCTHGSEVLSELTRTDKTLPWQIKSCIMQCVNCLCLLQLARSAAQADIKWNLQDSFKRLTMCQSLHRGSSMKTSDYMFQNKFAKLMQCWYLHLLIACWEKKLHENVVFTNITDYAEAQGTTGGLDTIWVRQRH